MPDTIVISLFVLVIIAGVSLTIRFFRLMKRAGEEKRIIAEVRSSGPVLDRRSAMLDDDLDETVISAETAEYDEAFAEEMREVMRTNKTKMSGIRRVSYRPVEDIERKIG